MKVMNEDNIALSQQWKSFYNTLCWVMLDLSQPQFILAWKLWQEGRKNKHGAPQTWARAFLKRLS